MKKLTSLCLVLLLTVSAFAQTLTVAEAIAIGQTLDNKSTSTETYTIEGYVNAIDENSFNTSYNNMTFWIADTRGNAAATLSGALQCYRCRPDRELVVGDKVRVVAPLKHWYETIETGKINAPVTWLESAPEDPDPEDPDPQEVTGSLRVCAQNLNNYYYNYTQTTRPSYSDEAGFQEKTQKIVNAMLDINADIYAFCEVEATPIALQHLAEAMSTQAGEAGRYVAVSDGIDYTWYEGIADNQIKSGFIYRTDRVKTYGSNTGATPGNGYYAHTMRIQAFRQLENGEKLVVSMNHFKAKDNSSDQGGAMRETNATNLLNALKKVNTDPDILVLGDLNCQVGETPITMITDAGYEEQLLKYDPYAWSHCYGSGELIDHVFANASMADQIVNAYVKHVSAYKCNPAVSSWESWSDHDPYVVEINLHTEVPETPCEDIDVSYLATGGTGLGDITAEKISGSYNWRYQSNYGATCQNKGGENWLLTPAYEMSKSASVNIAFDHTIGYANADNMTNEMTLWVTPDFSGVADSEWHQLTIPTYPTLNKNWPDFVHASVDVPTEYLGTKTAFGFKYAVPSDAAKSPTWEIQNLRITAQCEGAASDVENVSEQQQAYKTLRHGQLIIIRSGVEYTVTGQRLY